MDRREDGSELELYYGDQSGSEDSEYGEGVDSDSNDENHPDNEYVVVRCEGGVWGWCVRMLFGYRAL